MKPRELTDAMVANAQRSRPWSWKVSIGPPRGVSDEDCGTVDALVERAQGVGFPDRIRIAIELEDGDLERIADGEPIWLTVFSDVLQPFSVDLDPPTWSLAQAPVDSGDEAP